MADEFGIVDIVYDAIEPVCGDFILYKGGSEDREARAHVTIRPLALNELTSVSKCYVNVNIFVKTLDKGRLDRQLMKESIRAIRSTLRSIRPRLGMYWKSRIVWSESLGEAKEGFDCTNIRLEVITEKD